MLNFNRIDHTPMPPFRGQSAECYWEDAFESCPDVVRITADNFSLLRDLLAGDDDEDSFLTSPVYYAFTGRLGLWLYRRRGAFLPVCWHPNLPGVVLVFPLRGRPNATILNDLLHDMPEPPQGVRYSRMRPDADAAALLNRVENTARRELTLEPMIEPILDWRFPIQILQTGRVAALSGGKYMHVRNRMRQLKGCDVKIKPFSAAGHRRAQAGLLHRWANHNAANRDEYESLSAPYESLFAWSLEKDSGLSGLMIFVDDALQAIGLWDVSNAERKTANLFANFCNVGINGLSEMLIVKSCEALSAQGVGYLNLGGSETANLDRFKAKFDPALSLERCSLDIAIHDEAAKPLGVVSA